MKKKIMNNLIPIVVCIVVFIIVFSLTSILMNSSQNKTSTNSIKVYNGSNIYKIEAKKKYIHVEKLVQVECIKDPCEPTKETSFKVKYTDKNKKLIDNLKGKAEINAEELDDEDLDVMSTIIKEKIKKTKKISYEIVSPKERNSSGYYKYKKRGYYVEEQESGKVLVVVAMGEKTSGGYNISISKVEENDSIFDIYVEEDSPEPGSYVTTALTSPIAGVEFSEMPNKINVYNIKTDEEYEQIIEEDNND